MLRVAEITFLRGEHFIHYQVVSSENVHMNSYADWAGYKYNYVHILIYTHIYGHISLFMYVV